MDWRQFEDFSRELMGSYFKTTLSTRKPNGIPKIFDLVSPDGGIIGDAKYLTLVKGEKYPPAKMMEIAGHVWLLEKTKAKRKFLVFGNQREVPELWLEKYRSLAGEVEFYFLDEKGKVIDLKKNEGSS